jgi:hypothetical protein
LGERKREREIER